MEMSKELVLLYFKNKSTFEEDRIVEEWLTRSPENTHKALKWLDELPDDEEKLFLKTVLAGNEVWRNTIAEIERTAVSPADDFGDYRKNALRFRLTYRQAYRYAAIFFSVFMLLFAYYVYRAHFVVVIDTVRGNVEHVVLPDGSTVTLNANSTLKYAYSWQGKPREAWLEGEGFFEIKNKGERQPFKVHLSGKKIIEVLGTEFNVMDKPGKSLIFLKSGSIVVRLINKTHSKDISLLPGELLELDGNIATTFTPENVANPEKYYSWTKTKKP